MSSALAHATAPHPGEMFRDTIQSMSFHFASTLNRRDMEYALEFFAPDAVMIAPEHPGGCGKVAIRALLDKMFEKKPLTVALTQLSIVQFGDFAVETGEYAIQVAQTGRWKPDERGRYITGWRRRPHGDPLITLTIWSRSSSPLPQRLLV